MSKKLLFVTAPLAALLAAAACSDDEPTTPETQNYAASLSGAGESPAISTGATGTATFTRDGSTVQYTLEVHDITGVTAAHIHTGAAGANGPVAVPLFAATTPVDIADGELISSSFDEADITVEEIGLDSLLVLMGNGGAYVNVHTEAHPAGEIRGQIQAQ